MGNQCEWLRKRHWAPVRPSNVEIGDCHHSPIEYFSPQSSQFLAYDYNIIILVGKSRKKKKTPPRNLSTGKCDIIFSWGRQILFRDIGLILAASSCIIGKRLLRLCRLPVSLFFRMHAASCVLMLNCSFQWRRRTNDKLINVYIYI